MLVCCEDGRRISQMSCVERMGCNHDHCKGSIQLKFTDEEKKIILQKYLEYVEQVSEDLETKIYFTTDEIVIKVLELVEDLK